jgi:hypothetical protein
MYAFQFLIRQRMVPCWYFKSASTKQNIYFRLYRDWKSREAFFQPGKSTFLNRSVKVEALSLLKYPRPCGNANIR